MNSTANMTFPGVDAGTEGPPTPGWDNSSGPDNHTDTPFDYDYEAYYYSLFLYNVGRYLTYASYGLTMLLGTLGNLLVIYTIWRCRHLHTVMYTLLASLSIADLIMIVIVLPWRLYISLYVGPWTFGDFMCRFPMYVYLLSAVSSVFHLTVISLERCYAVLFPLRSRTVLTMGNAYRIVFIVWLVSIVASIPIWFSRSTQLDYDEYWGGWYYRCLSNWTDDISKRAFSLYVFFLIFGVPIILIVGAYSIIFVTLFKRRVPNETIKTGAIPMNQTRKYQAGNGTAKTGSVYIANGSQKINRSTARNKKMEIKQLTVMLMVVVTLFAVSWGPTVTLVVLNRFEVIDPFSNLWRMVSTIFSLMSLMNSAANPIVYALISPNFRESCSWALKVCCKSRNVRRRPSAVSRATAVSRVGMGTGGGSVTYVDNVSVSSSACAGDKI